MKVSARSIDMPIRLRFCQVYDGFLIRRRKRNSYTRRQNRINSVFVLSGTSRPVECFSAGTIEGTSSIPCSMARMLLRYLKRIGNFTLIVCIISDRQFVFSTDCAQKIQFFFFFKIDNHLQYSLNVST